MNPAASTPFSVLPLRVTHRYAAPPERVFDAWLDPARAARFLFATPDGTMVRAEIDARVGGRYTFVDRRDGEDVLHTGEYVEIDRPRSLVYTFTVPKYDPRTTRVAIGLVAESGGGCTLTLTHSGVDVQYAEQTRQGWQAILGTLDTIL
jgi:uncharacterized protein YndB with AHSA1/START domain